MPIYEFICKDCGFKFERLYKSLSEARRAIFQEGEKCPKCDSKNIEKIISNLGGIIFKGSGFYSTDYKGKK